jgi:uncharacterized protein YggE
MDATRANRSGITVIGTGTASSPVDQVTITLGVEVQRTDPGDAFRVVAGTATALLALLADHGVDSRSVRTSNLTLVPEWDYRDGRNHRIGYQARQDFVVTVEGLAGVDRMLTDVANRAGEGVTIGGISLLSAEPAAAMARARAAAFADASGRAEQLAALAGRTLGPVEWVDEGGPVGGPEPRMYRTAAVSAGAAPMPIAAGDTPVTVTLVVHYSLAD